MDSCDDCMADESAPYPERELIEAKLLKMNDDEPSNQELSKSIKGHSLNINESSATMDLQHAKPGRLQSVIKQVKPVTLKPKTPKGINSARNKIVKEVEVKSEGKSSEERSAELPAITKESQPQIRVIKGKRRNARERKFYEKRRKQIEQVFPSVKEIGSVEWDTLIMKLSRLPAGQDTEKLNPCK